MVQQPTKDVSTVSANGQRKQQLIEGVYVRSAVNQIDERGSF